jgi:glycerophosphoryl diester phosphodiesterase
MATVSQLSGNGGPPGGEGYRRIGHKGADSIAPGNTLESFLAAASNGVDMIELDVIRNREGRLVIAHDYQDANSRRPLELSEALDSFWEPPLDQLEIDCDLKLAGREAELAGTLAGHGLLERAMVSTMEISSILKLRALEPDLRLGWTYPKTRRDWTRYRWAGPGVAAGLAAIRRSFPRLLSKRAPELGVSAVWAYHQLITPRLIEAARSAGVELIAWTVDDASRIAVLAELGVDGICTNDPRLFDEADELRSAQPAGPAAVGAEQPDAESDGSGGDRRAPKAVEPASKRDGARGTGKRSTAKDKAKKG